MSTSKNNISATTIRGLFTKPLPQVITEEPNHENLRRVFKDLYENAQNVPYPHDGGTYGILGMIMPAADYANLPHTTAWTDPAVPAAEPNYC